MLRWLFILLVLSADATMAQPIMEGRLSPLPPDQLQFETESGEHTENYRYMNYMSNRFSYPDYVPVTIPSKNIYSSKDLWKLDLFDNKGQLRYQFEFGRYGELVGGIITDDHKIRWHNYQNWNPYYRPSYYPQQKVLTRVEAHYDKRDRLAKLDSVITTYYLYRNADTTISYHSTRHYTYLSGSTVNERNNYYNTVYYKKKLSAPNNGLNVQNNGKSKKGYIYLRTKLPENYKPDSIYLDHFIRFDENLIATVDNGRKEIHQKLPEHNFIKNQYDSVIKNEYGTIGADFREPGWTCGPMPCLTAMGRHIAEKMEKEIASLYMCTLNRKNLVDSVFYFGYPRHVQPSNRGALKTHVYTVRYTHFPGSCYSDNDNEMPPQLVVREQLARYGGRYFQANFGKSYHVPSNNLTYPADVTPFVKNRVKVIHVYYHKDRELEAFELDTSGKIVGGMESYGSRRWRTYTDKSGNRFTLNEYYDDGWLEKKDSTVYLKKEIRLGDTTISFMRSKSLIYKKGRLIAERNREYNEQYLNKRIKTTNRYPPFGALNTADPLAPKEGYIFLNKRLRTDYDGDKLYLCVEGVGDYEWTMTVPGRQLKGHALAIRDTLEINKSMLINLRSRKILVAPDVKYPESGEDFNPPNEYSGPICGGGGGSYGDSYRGETDGREIFKSFSWTFNSKGLYDTCYKTDPVIHYRSHGNEDAESDGTPQKKAPTKWPIYVIRYEYY